MKRRLVLMLVLLQSLTLGIMAQNIKVAKTDGTSVEYKEVKEMSFDGDNVTILTSQGNFTEQADEVEKVMFGAGRYNGHEYVDLGLPSGLKWATCNVGSDSPEDYGSYFAWREVKTKNSYTINNSLAYGMSESSLKSQGIIDKNGNLTPSYDAATVNWGGTWRMPTLTEIKELINYCSWTWTTQNGRNGYRVKGPNGNSIFFPAAGYRHDTSLNSVGGYGYYWSATVNANDSNYAYNLDFYSGNQDWYCDSSRSRGQSVRPVSE